MVGWEKQVKKNRWFWLGMAAILVVSLALRFWGLGRFNTLVFDEVYYANFASKFLQGRQEFGGHPPLSTYLIAGGIWISEQLGWGSEATRNGLTGLYISTVSYRWLNALTGAWIPLVVGAIAFQLTHRRTYALIAALLMALDGMFLVESRYALNNVYLVLFGLLGHLGLLIALNRVSAPQGKSRSLLFPLVLSGVGFGASIGIKWNGAGFVLGAIALWVLAWIVKWVRPQLLDRPALPMAATDATAEARLDSEPSQWRSPLAALPQLKLWQVALTFGVIPAITYYVSWLPYAALNPEVSVWEWQGQVLSYHERVGGMDAHPYCSRWLSWLWMIRPVAYFYQTAHAPGEPSPIVGPPLPNEAGRIIYDVHAMGNPPLWWASTLAIAVVLGLVVLRGGQAIARSRGDGHAIAPFAATGFPVSVHPLTWVWTAVFLCINWGANFLPWAKVTRCTFIYHYMGSLVFAILAIALLVDGWLDSLRGWHRVVALTTVLVVALGFIFWLPLFLGLPISPADMQTRRWFASWI
ncbi:phospholipid carrier-dependent glycosyltransferase [Leptolyngbya sp. AN02str]|uniref:phospholipid carrier-dependent glycosyltransferase n=1 Tax=Leptolyngbya sp. AN02str TaxID=3423363 RepID=UPI003D312265